MQSIYTWRELQDQGFAVKQDTLFDEPVVLVTPPHIGLKFTQANKIYRSSLWTLDGRLISAGFPKFVNLGENPEHFPDPTNVQLRHAIFTKKLDGSLLICSQFKAQLIARTRGTIDARKMNNGWELDELLARYSGILGLLNIHDISLLFEWTTPNNQIVIKYPEPDLTLVGGIDHNTYKIFTQDALDRLGADYGVPRPQQYDFSDYDSVQEIAEEISTWSNNEGVCVYYKNLYGWEIKKIKSAEYLKMHAFKSEMTLEKLLDLYIQIGQVSYVEFTRYIRDNYDYECLTYVQGWISKIMDASDLVEGFFSGARRFIQKNGLADLPRKEAALKIISAYGETGRTGILFSMLDGKNISDQQLKTLYLQNLK